MEEQTPNLDMVPSSTVSPTCDDHNKQRKDTDITKDNRMSWDVSDRKVNPILLQNEETECDNQPKDMVISCNTPPVMEVLNIQPVPTTTMESKEMIVSSSNMDATSPDEMFKKFRNWAISNYGDSGKTKTVTRKKYCRIVQILTGDEQPCSDNSKFRFWVKNKGFRLGPPPPDEAGAEDQVLYVPTRVQVRFLYQPFILY